MGWIDKIVYNSTVNNLLWKVVMSEQAQIVFQAYAQAIIETVQESGDNGAPEGMLYAASMMHGIDLETFEAVVDYCIRSGKIRRVSHVLYAVR